VVLIQGSIIDFDVPFNRDCCNYLDLGRNKRFFVKQQDLKIKSKDLITEFAAFLLLITNTNTVGWGNKLVMVFAWTPTLTGI